MKTLFLVMTLVGSLFLTGCGNYLKNKTSDQNKDLAATGGTTKLTFAIIKEQILQKNCIECHTGRHVAYESYAVVKPIVNEIVARVTSTDSSRRMPRGSSALPQALQDQLIEWVNAGAPEFAEGDDSGGEEPSGEIFYSFADIKENVLKPNNCLNCHSQYNDYLPTRRVATSLLSLVLSNKMPYGPSAGSLGDPVSDKQKKMLMDWVSQGAPEFVGMPVPSLEEEVQPNWISLRNNVLGPKCIMCHNSYGKRGPTAMETYEELEAWFTKNPYLFNFDDPEGSHFIGSIQGKVDDACLNGVPPGTDPASLQCFFDPMPFNRFGDDVADVEPVTEENLNVIRQWIKLKIPKK